jgi:hypothetical protein
VFAGRQGHLLALESYRSEKFLSDKVCIGVFSILFPSFMLVFVQWLDLLWGFLFYLLFLWFCLFLLFHYCVVLAELHIMYLILFCGAAWSVVI